MAVKENETVNNKSPYSESKDSPFKKRPFGPVLKGRQTKPPAPGAPRGWVWASLVTGRGCHFAQDKKRTENNLSFFSAIFFAAALIEGCCLISGSFARCGGRPGAVRPGPGPDCVR